VYADMNRLWLYCLLVRRDENTQGYTAMTLYEFLYSSYDNAAYMNIIYDL